MNRAFTGPDLPIVTMQGQKDGQYCNYALPCNTYALPNNTYKKIEANEGAIEHTLGISHAKQI